MRSHVYSTRKLLIVLNTEKLKAAVDSADDIRLSLQGGFNLSFWHRFSNTINLQITCIIISLKIFPFFRDLTIFCKIDHVNCLIWLTLGLPT